MYVCVRKVMNDFLFIYLLRMWLLTGLHPKVYIPLISESNPATQNQ